MAARRSLRSSGGTSEARVETCECDGCGKTFMTVEGLAGHTGTTDCEQETTVEVGGDV